MFYRISISHSTRRLTRSVEHQLGGCETEGSEIVAETAEKSLRNRCFRSSHFSANSTTISASMTDKMPFQVRALTSIVICILIVIFQVMIVVGARHAVNTVAPQLILD